MSRAPRVPTVGEDPREGLELTEPADKIWFRDLDEAVIEADRCIQCGTCVAACPSDSIGVDDLEDRPTLVAMCTGCSRCWDFCPRSGLRYERVLAEERSAPTIHAARSRSPPDGAQDGGVVTALLERLLEAGEIDGALVAEEDPNAPLKARSVLATDAATLQASAGSGYTQPMQLGHLEEHLTEAGLEDGSIALVGTPCVIQGARALERHEWDGEVAAIDLTVALMCTRSFEYPRLTRRLRETGVDPAACERLDVTGGILSAVDETGSVLLETPVEDFDEAALRGCAECTDLVGAAADVSAGSIGSPDGYTTILLNTDRGERAWETAVDALETTAADPEALQRVDSWNERRGTAVMPREYDPDGSLGISLTAHREAYEDTDRAPRPLNPARVHQYERWC